MKGNITKVTNDYKNDIKTSEDKTNKAIDTKHQIALGKVSDLKKEMLESISNVWNQNKKDMEEKNAELVKLSA